MRVYSVLVGACFMILLASGAAVAGCSSTISCLHPAPAPLLAAGIPAFAALGGGAAAYRLWRKFGRRS